jgi:hypothetical protein
MRQENLGLLFTDFQLLIECKKKKDPKFLEDMSKRRRVLCSGKRRTFGRGINLISCGIRSLVNALSKQI